MSHVTGYVFLMSHLSHTSIWTLCWVGFKSLNNNCSVVLHFRTINQPTNYVHSVANYFSNKGVAYTLFNRFILLGKNCSPYSSLCFENHLAETWKLLKGNSITCLICNPRVANNKMLYTIKVLWDCGVIRCDAALFSAGRMQDKCTFLKNIIFTAAYLIIFTTGAWIPCNAFSL